MSHPSCRPSCMLVICWMAMGAVPRTAHAQGEFNRYMTAAVRLYESLEYERALDQVRNAKRLAREVDQNVTVALYEGVILADMGKREESQAAFKTGLLLDPEAKLPFKVSPKVARDFEEVRVRVRQELARTQPAPPTVAGTDRPERSPAPNLNAPAPEAPALDVSARESARSRVPVTSLVLAGVGVAAAGVGAVFGLKSRANTADADALYASGLPSQAGMNQAHAYLGDARGQARAANVLFGTAALAAGGAVITYLLAPHDTGVPNKEVR